MKCSIKYFALSPRLKKIAYRNYRKFNENNFNGQCHNHLSSEQPKCSFRKNCRRTCKKRKEVYSKLQHSKHFYKKLTPRKKFPWEKSPHPKLCSFQFLRFFELLLSCFYVIFKILLYSKLICSLIKFNLATLCNLVI